MGYASGKQPASPWRNTKRFLRTYRFTLLLDESAPIVWLVQSDGAGYKTVVPYSITPYQPAPTVDVGNLENRVKRLEDMLNGKSDITGNAGKHPGDSE